MLPDVSVVVIIGDERRRAERILAALAKQTFLGRMEVIVVDMASASAASVVLPAQLQGSILCLPPDTLYGKARVEAIRRCRSDLIAFIEEHCVPEPGWAEAVYEQASRGYQAVGYAFTNGSPDSFLYRSAFIAEYGSWATPAVDGPSLFMPGNNVAYRRDALLGSGDRLEILMEVDFLLQKELARTEPGMAIAARAVTAHETNKKLLNLFGGHFAISRLFGARRAELEAWPLSKRLLIGLIVPAAVPVLRLYRLLSSLRGRRSLVPRFLEALPLIIPIYTAAALGEAWGYLRPDRIEPELLTRVELDTPRASRS